MVLPGRGRLTGGTVIPSGNPLNILRRDHHAVKRRVIASSLGEGIPLLIKPGQRTLFSLGRRIVYERETRTRKPKPKPDALSQWRTMEEQRNYVTWMAAACQFYYSVLKYVYVIRVVGKFRRHYLSLDLTFSDLVPAGGI